MFPCTFSIIYILSDKQGFQHARRSSPEGTITTSGFRLVEDRRSSDEGILAPTGWKNVGQLTYGRVSQTGDAKTKANQSRGSVDGVTCSRGKQGKQES